jgi:cytochrome b561
MGATSKKLCLKFCSGLRSQNTLHMYLGLYIYIILYTRMFVGKPNGKEPLGRPRRRWEDIINMDLQEVGGGRGD